MQRGDVQFAETGGIALSVGRRASNSQCIKEYYFILPRMAADEQKQALESAIIV